jgi:hypothetical protein
MTIRNGSTISYTSYGYCQVNSAAVVVPLLVCRQIATALSHDAKAP